MTFFDDYEPFYQKIREVIDPKLLGNYVEMHLSDGTFYIYDNENVNKAKILFKGCLPEFIHQEYQGGKAASYQRRIQ